MKRIEFIMLWIWRLVYLNFLWVLFSLLLVTIIPSTFTLFKMMDQCLKSSDQVPTFNAFKKIFISQIRSSYLFSIPILILTGILWLDFSILRLNNSSLGNVWFYMIAALTLLLFVVINFAIYLLVSTDLPINKTLTIGFVISIRYPLHGLLIVLAYIVGATLFLLQTGIGLMLMGSLLSLVLCVIARHALQLFEQYLLKQSV